jgi:hypothetical protein
MSFEAYKHTKPALMIKATLDLLFPNGEVFEVRIPKTKMGTISGYFNDTSIAASLIAKENGKHQSIYVTANPVNPALLGRTNNRFEFGTHLTTTDADIVKRNWFLMDFDPVRPVGISATDGEVELAVERADAVTAWLVSLGWPEPIKASSGNGVHLMFKMDEPNDDPTRIDVECALKMMAGVFSDDAVKVDITVFNASRVWKIYGTISAKGASTEDRPHRVAQILSVPDVLTPVTRDQLSAMASPIRDAKADEYRDMAGEFIGDMAKWLEDRGQKVVSGPRPLFGNEGQKWIISKCPFNDNHLNPLVGLVNNRPVYRCLHDSCSANRWKEFREKVDPTYKDPETVYDRLKQWCDGEEASMDGDLIQAACATGKKLADILKKLRKESSRARVLLLEDLVKQERRRFQAATIGENNEKGNVVGLINRTRLMQGEGSVPMFWIAEHDHRIRVGPVGDVNCPRLSTTDEINLLVKFHSMGDSWVKQIHMVQVINYLAEEYRVNPLRVHLKQMRWDGTKRLDNWLPHYMGTKDTEYTRAIGRKWMISAVARAMEPGCQADHMLIFEGEQGIGKSQALRILGGQFYSEYSGGMTGTGTAHKDMVAVIIGKMIVEMSELATVRKGDMESLKAILTTCVDDVRLSYERDAKSYPRTCVMAGTTNEVGQAYIHDLTGARRFWPTHVGECGPVRLDLLKQDRDQLWAEAIEAYEGGEDWYKVPTEMVREEQADRQMSIENAEPWFHKIRQGLTDPDNFGSGVLHAVPRYVNGQITEEFVVRLGTLDQVLGVMLQIDIARQSATDVARLTKILRGIGFKKTRPSGKWMGSSYAYDLVEEAVPHLWTAIKAAKETVKFPKAVEQEN